MIREVIELVDHIWAGLTVQLVGFQVAATAHCNIELIEAALRERWGWIYGSTLEKDRKRGENVTSEKRCIIIQSCGLSTV